MNHMYVSSFVEMLLNNSSELTSRGTNSYWGLVRKDNADLVFVAIRAAVSTTVGSDRITEIVIENIVNGTEIVSDFASKSKVVADSIRTINQTDEFIIPLAIGGTYTLISTWHLPKLVKEDTKDLPKNWATLINFITRKDSPSGFNCLPSDEEYVLLHEKTISPDIMNAAAIIKLNILRDSGDIYRTIYLVRKAVIPSNEKMFLIQKALLGKTFNEASDCDVSVVQTLKYFVLGVMSGYTLQVDGFLTIHNYALTKFEKLGEVNCNV